MSTPAPPRYTVVDVPEASRYEVRGADHLMGFGRYRLTPGVITFLHTEVLPEFEGHGVGSRLARAMLQDARERGLRVRPLCPFIAAFIRNHPEYADLVGPAPPAAPRPSD